MCRRIPERFGLDPVDQVQILTPMHKGSVGTENLNRELRAALNPHGQELKGGRFSVGDRVMQVRKQLRQGSVSTVMWARSVRSTLNGMSSPLTLTVGRSRIIFPRPTNSFSRSAVTVHKAQGSEYPRCRHSVDYTALYAIAEKSALYGHDAGEKSWSSS